MAATIGLLRIEARAENCGAIQACLAQNCGYGWQEKDIAPHGIAFEIYNDDDQYLLKLQARAASAAPGAQMTLTRVDKKDWTSAWREFFTPVECGSHFVILPPWLAHMEHSTRKEIIIEPSVAFGTGHHASTRLCLCALSLLAGRGMMKKGGWFLDLGCGSGVLGIAAAKLGMDGTGLDIDPLAIANARANRELNEAVGLELLKGDLDKVKREKFDLVMANILAQPLIDMAPQLLAALKKDGALVLGGILDTQAQAVADAYGELGAPEILAEDEWRALLWQPRP